MAKILVNSQGNHKAQIPKFSVFAGQKSTFRDHFIKNFKGGLQIRLSKISKENATHFRKC